MEYTVRVKMYYRLLNQISSSTRIISFLKNEFLENIEQLVANSCRIILLMILRVLYHIQRVSVNLSILELKKYETTLFIPFITFIEKYFSRNKPSEDDVLIKPILDFLWITSKEISIIPIFINIQCPKICLQWLSLSYLRSEEYQRIINILNNIARHDEGTIILNKYKCEEIFNKFIKEVLSIKIDYIIDYGIYKKLLFTVTMMTFLTQNSSDIENIHDYEIIHNILLPAIETSLSSSTLMYFEFCTSELLFILMKLFTNDNIVNYIFEKYMISTFFSNVLTTLLIDMENISDQKILSMIILANIFWSISFQDQYKNDLIQNKNLIPTFEIFLANYVLSSTSISRQIFPLKRAIDGIKQNLYPTKPVAISATNKSLHSLMISYSYIDLDFYRKLYDILNKTSKLSIYSDADNRKQIGQNIEQSDIILFLISKEFFTNKSCRQELIYVTDILKKPFIPVFIDQDFKPIGWLHKRIDRVKCIRFGERDLMESCEELLSMINENLSMNLSLENNSLDIKKWNEKEVKQWFINNNLISELYEFYQFQNGNELFLYAQAISTYSWTKEYERIRSSFAKKFQEQEQNLSSHEFLKFINALERIKYLN